MDIFSRVVLSVGITIIALSVAGVVLMYVLLPYFPEGYEPYAEEFKELDEVKALYRVYPMAEPNVNADGRIAYLATSGNGSGAIDLAIYHKHHSFEVIGMRLTCWDGGGGPPVWSVDEDILHHIESRRCF